jgi:hypothetical protein
VQNLDRGDAVEVRVDERGVGPRAAVESIAEPVLREEDIVTGTSVDPIATGPPISGSSPPLP